MVLIRMTGIAMMTSCSVKLTSSLGYLPVKEDKMPFNLLSKTKYIAGLQCTRLIWTQFHEQERIPETDPVTQHIFTRGISLVSLPRSCSLTVDRQR
jgi:hypothetical protein